MAIAKGASTLLIPISARRQLKVLSDEMAMKISVLFYADVKEALLKARGDQEGDEWTFLNLDRAN